MHERSSHGVITVAVPTCNGAAHLREALSSVARSEVAVDFLVVDDRSDDESLAIVGEVLGDRAQVEVNSERLGLAGNWNRCVDMSRTPLVAIFHQDDLMRPGHLASHVRAYEATPSIGWIASAADVVDGGGAHVPASIVSRGGLGPADRSYGAGEVVADLIERNPLRCSGVTLSAAVHRRVGGFDPAYRYVVDWDFWLRVARVRPVLWLAEPTVAIRWHSASETHRFSRGTLDLDETARMLDRQAAEGLPSDQFPEGWRARADRHLARAFLNRAHLAFRRGDASLARHALGRALNLAAGHTLGLLALDPRFLAQMLAAHLAPGWVDGRADSTRPARERCPAAGARLSDGVGRVIMEDPT